MRWITVLAAFQRGVTTKNISNYVDRDQGLFEAGARVSWSGHATTLNILSQLPEEQSDWPSVQGTRRPRG
jgi:hypothetical protein